ncbi:hypothetical protein HW130_02900 [Streptomyces sp. PKU-EA00015]|uniref:hypothetical protein n=1 Tax=Streptomyces sp. PKU-EA00015 TaxID=2748326 RepID=UPI0015A0A9F8|nr:hypothetical protein [Streptomyces sp. PKU-EA00015]NWF25219.1 hypothetical protein [Streptomyces sp. PKU-EA00015]
MGRVKPGKPHRERLIRETREPEQPLPDWPKSHVSAELTGDDQFECVLVTIHGVEHYLHASTARELQLMLDSKLKEYNGVCEELGVPQV